MESRYAALAREIAQGHRRKGDTGRLVAAGEIDLTERRRQPGDSARGAEQLRTG